MQAVGRSIVSLLLVLSACGSGERACDLLEDLPDRADRMSIEQIQEVADAARASDRPRIRAIGEELTLNLARRQALETILAGAPIELMQMNLDALRQACANLAP
jgi:hypothetical protein